LDSFEDNRKYIGKRQLERRKEVEGEMWNRGGTADRNLKKNNKVSCVA
jgi:hypothetical protein